MHIGFITPEYPHPSLERSGGLGTSIKNLASALVVAGHQATIFVVNQNHNNGINDEGVKVIVIKKTVYPFFSWYRQRKFWQKLIANEVKIHNIDLLEAPDWTGITAFMTFKTPLIIRLHGSDGYFCYLEKRNQKQTNRLLEKRALLKADTIVSVSQFTASVTKHVFRLPEKILYVIPNGINVDQFKPLDTKIKHNQILYFGTVVRKKGVLELAYMFNLLIEKEPKAELLFLGKDNIDVFTKTSTIDLIKNILTAEALKKVRFLGEVPYKDVKHYIASAHVVTLPSFAEAFPMTWLESLAMEKALVTSDIGWAKELMVHGETGFTVNPKDHKSYADYIIKIINSPELCERLGKRGRQIVSNKFSNTKITKKNIEFYKKIIPI
ncbi:glycosyltransferase family 4 protein [Formosa sp. 4Alg 33]|uniref:glycosyltransferase family 4 protein n=1 Tax=Formosa sp. 4Alg 33 TaxID=3382189 RepID=UPI003D9C02E1